MILESSLAATTMEAPRMPSSVKVRHTPPPANYVPSDYSDLYDKYFTYIKRLVSKYGIDPLNAEDVAMTLLAKFIEKDALADFNPEYDNGHERQAVFSSFLSGFVIAYVRHHRDRQNIHKVREPLLMDAVGGVGESAYNGADNGADNVTWADRNAAPVIETYEDLYAQEFVQTALARIRANPPQRKRRVSLEAFFLRLAQQVEENGKHNTPELAAEFGVSENCVRNWIVELRGLLQDIKEDS